MSSSNNCANDVDRQAVLVLGPHRSGTSLATCAIQHAGFDLGSHLLAPNVDNPKGFFENAEVVTFNDRLLKHLGLCWDYLGPVDYAAISRLSDEWMDAAGAIIEREFGGARRIGIKDPRSCLLARFWREVLVRKGYVVSFVLVLRHPLECAASQLRRRLNSPSLHFIGPGASGVLLWARYLNEALRQLEDCRFATVSYQCLLDTPALALGGLAESMRLPVSPAAIAAFTRDYVSPELYREQQARLDKIESPGIAALVEAYSPLEGVRSSTDHDDPDVANLIRAIGRVLEPSHEFDDALLQTFVAARHAAVESHLELLEAKRIIAFQESALAKAALETSGVREQLDRTQRLLLSERAGNERLALQQAVKTDRSST